MFVFMLVQFPTLAEVLWSNENTNHIYLIKHFLVFISTAIIAILIATLFVSKTAGISYLKTKITLKNVYFAVAMAILSQVIQFFISMLSATNNNSDQSLIEAFHTSLLPITFITIILLSPFLEELLFQGVLQGYLLSRLNPWLNIIITASIFAIVHGYSFSLGTLELFFSGLAYALVFYFTKDLKMAFLSHATANLIVLLLDIIPFFVQLQK